VAAVGLAGPAPAHQPTEPRPKTDAVLVVEGTVRQVFRSTRQDRAGYLVEILVRSSEARGEAPPQARVRYPAPGEVVYVYATAQEPQKEQRFLVDKESGTLPAENARVRAYLTPRDGGGWEGVRPDWFESVAAAPSAPAPSPPASRPVSTAALGMSTERILVGDREALKVTSIERGGPAQKAGFEVGDVIAALNTSDPVTAERLDALISKGEPFPVVVVDVNTGRKAQVVIRPAPVAQTDKPAPKPTEPTPEPPSRSLGLTAEPVSLGQRTAVKVVRVEAGGPAAAAGLEPGDVIVAANGAAVTGLEQLASAARKSGPTLVLTVRDVRSGKDTPVNVAIGGPEPTAPQPQPAPTAPAEPGKGSPGLGAVTELAFYNTDFAVKVTEVEQGSPADRAGLRAGDLIVQANGKPVLHPNDLAALVRATTGALKLTVVKHETGQKGDVEVTLPRRE
jgi:S1-C subfamily serine protease